MGGQQRVRKLRWLCRRGMKELDILLAAFIARHEQELESGCWEDFESLLRFEDDVLWDCLQDPGCSEAGRHRPLIKRIRDNRA